MATLSWDQVFIQANKSVMRAVCVCVCVCVCACARMRLLTWGTKISLHTFLGKTPFPFLPSCIRISHFASMNGWSSGLTNRFHLLFQIWSIYCGCLELWIRKDSAVSFGLSRKESHDLLIRPAMSKAREVKVMHMSCLYDIHGLISWPGSYLFYLDQWNGQN